MNAEDQEVLQQAVGKTIRDVEVKGYHTVTLVFTDGNRLRLWAWDEYGRDGVGMSGEWMQPAFVALDTK